MPSTVTDRLAGLTTSVAIKPPCVVTTTGAITLSGEQTIDGVAVVEGDRVLVKDQSTDADNGIYTVSLTTWTRALDFDSARDVTNGTLVMVNGGSDPGRVWRCDATDDPVLIGTSDINFSHAELVAAIPAGSQTTAGALELATRAEINADDATRAISADQLLDSKFDPNGVHIIPIPAGAMFGATTNGAATGQIETTTNKVNIKVLDFDTSTVEYACFTLPMPESWNEGTITFKAIWTAASGSGGVAWSLQGLATSDDDTLDTAYGTAVTVTDTLITANDNHTTTESAAITISGTPQAGDLVAFRIARETANGSDNLGVDARLIGIRLYITTTTGTDA